MTHALRSTLPVYLLASGQIGRAELHDHRVEVRGLTALDYFEYQEFLIDLPRPDYSAVDKTDQRALQRFALATERYIYALNLRMLALSTRTEAAQDLSTIERELSETYPLGAHIAQLAAAVAICSGLVSAPEQAGDEAASAEPAEDAAKNG